MQTITTADVTARMLSDFCRKKLTTVLAPREVELFREYILNLLDQRKRPANKGRGLRWDAIAIDCGIEEERLRGASNTIRIGFDALGRALIALPPKPASQAPCKPAGIADPKGGSPKIRSKRKDLEPLVTGPQGRPKKLQTPPSASAARRPGVKPRPIVEFPEALFDTWDDPGEFHEALDLHMRRFGDSYW